MSHIFISYSREDLTFAQKIVDALAANDLDTWIDWKSIPKGEDWEQEIYRGIEEADAFLFLISSDSVVSEMCNKEILHAIINGKRILPIFIVNVENKEVYGVTGKFLREEIREEIDRRNFIFCRDERDNFNKAIEEIHTTIQTDYEWLKYHTRLQVKALEWKRSKDTSRLLRGKELRDAEEQLAESQIEPPPTEVQRHFILVSRQNEDERRRRLTTGLVVGLLVMLGIVIIAVLQWQRAERQVQIARAGELAAQSLRQLDQRDYLSMLLSIEAFRTADTLQTRQTLYTIWHYQPDLLQVFPDSQSVAFSPDGELVAVGASNGTIQLWNARTIQPIGEPLVGHTGAVTTLIFNPQNQTLASGSVDGTIRLWDIATGNSIGDPLIGDYSSENRDDILTLDYSPDGLFLASGNKEGAIYIWDVQSQQKIKKHLYGHTLPAYSVAFNTDGRTLASGGGGGDLLLWDIETDVIEPLYPGGGAIKSVAFSPDGQTLASANVFGEIDFYDVATRKLSSKFNAEFGVGVNSIAYNPNEFFYIVGMTDGSIQEWHTGSGETTSSKFINEGSGEVNFVSYSSDGKNFASVSSDNVVRLWSEGYLEIGKFLPGPVGDISSIAFGPDGKIIAAGSNDNNIRLWDLNSNQQLEPPLTGHEFSIRSIAFSRDGQLASGSRGGMVILWDLNTGQPAQTLIGHTDDVNAVAFSPNGKNLASGSSDDTIRLWDVDPRSSTFGQQLGEFIVDQQFPEFVVGFPGDINTVAFSPDGRLLVSGSNDDTIRLWDVDLNSSTFGQQVRDSLNGHGDDVNIVAFSPDGKILVSGSADRTIILWDIATGRPLRTLKRHDDEIDSISFSPDGAMLASGSVDGAIYLWDVASGLPFGERLSQYLPSSPLYDFNVTFSPDGQTLAFGGPALELWDISPELWIKYTCQRLGRNLTEDEWNQYLYWEPYDSGHQTCPRRPAGE